MSSRRPAVPQWLVRAAEIGKLRFVTGAFSALGIVLSIVGVTFGWSGGAVIAVCTALVAVAAQAVLGISVTMLERRAATTEEIASTALTKLKDYRAVLAKFFSDDISLQEEQTVTLTLGADGVDHYAMEASTTPNGHERCRWRRVRIQANTASNEHVEATLLSGGGKLLKLDDEPGYWSALVVFDPPIEPHQPRRWSIDIRWPGMADPLRVNGTDSLWFYTVVPVTKAKLRVRYPTDWVDEYGPAPAAFLQRSPEIGLEHSEADITERVLEWEIEAPELGQNYVADLRRSAAETGATAISNDHD